MAHNVQTMAYYGEVPWHGLGIEIPARADASQMIKAAGLDWEVEKRPARGAITDTKGSASRYEIVRLPRKGTNEQEVLFGVVTRRYEPLQNHKAFEFFDPIIKGDEACFETAGALGAGEKIWALAKMPGAIEVVRGDACMKYLLLSNTHDGKGSVSIKFTSIRVVCQNTLMLAMDDGQAIYRVRHTKTMDERLKEVAEILAAAKTVYERSAEIFKRLARKQINKAIIEQYLELIFPRTKKQKDTGVTPEKWINILKALETADDLQLQGVKGTMWALYNAVTGYEDYRLPRNEETHSQRLNRTWFGSSANIKLSALVQAQKIAVNA